MAALGMNRRQLVTLGMARNLAVASLGLRRGGVATALSPIAPVGEARIAETATGLAFDTPVLLLGATRHRRCRPRSWILAGNAGRA